MYQHRLCQLTQTSSSNFAGVNSQGNQLFVKCLCKACLGKDAGPQCFILDDWVETHAKQAKLPDDDSAEVLVRQYIQASGEGFEAPVRERRWYSGTVSWLVCSVHMHAAGASASGRAPAYKVTGVSSKAMASLVASALAMHVRGYRLVGTCSGALLAVCSLPVVC